MSKALGKVKLPKDRPKKEKSDRNNDDAPTVRTKDKDKDKPRSKNAFKKKHASAFSEEHLSTGTSHAVLDDTGGGNQRVRSKKKRRSKSCEETVHKAVSDLFDCAWIACAERFFITTAPTTVSFELRNTWLRIMEAEWLDQALQENKSRVKPNRIFKRDTAPLPLAFDAWSRGALEPLPRIRRESVIDPFLRDINNLTQYTFPARLKSHSMSHQLALFEERFAAGEFETSLSGSPEDNLEFSVEETEHIPETKPATKEDSDHVSPPQDIPEGDKWDFNLDQNISTINLEPQPDSALALSPAPSDLNSFTAISQQSNGDELEEKSLSTVLSAKVFGWSDSSTEKDTSSSPASKRINGPMFVKKRGTVTPKMPRFSAGQCGGKTGSGVFRLHLETTSEALLRMRNSLHHIPSEAPLFEDLNEQSDQKEEKDEQLIQRVHASQASQASQAESTESIQPLFSERKTVVQGQDMHMHHNLENHWGRRPSFMSIDRVASDIEKKFLKRRLANLHGHFKRQTRRALAARARQKREAALLAAQASSSTCSMAWSKISSVSGNTGNSNRTRHNGRESAAAGNRAKSTASDSQFLVENANGRLGDGKANGQLGVGKGNANGAKTEQKQAVGSSTANKNVKSNNFKQTGNVRSSYNVKGDLRMLAGKFEDSKNNKNAAIQTQMRARIENGRLSRIGKQANVLKTDELLQSTLCYCRTIDSCSGSASPP